MSHLIKQTNFLISFPPPFQLFSLFFPNEPEEQFTGSDAKTCYKGSGFGECRSYNFGETILKQPFDIVQLTPAASGNTWYEEIGDCPRPRLGA